MFSGCGVGVEPRTPQNLIRIGSRAARGAARLVYSLVSSDVRRLASIAGLVQGHDLGGWPCRTGLQISAYKEDEFPMQGFEFLLGSGRFEHPPAHSCHGSLKHRSDQLRVFRERFTGAG